MGLSLGWKGSSEEAKSPPWSWLHLCPAEACPHPMPGRPEVVVAEHLQAPSSLPALVMG